MLETRLGAESKPVITSWGLVVRVAIHPMSAASLAINQELSLGCQTNSSFDSCPIVEPFLHCCFAIAWKECQEVSSSFQAPAFTSHWLKAVSEVCWLQYWRQKSNSFSSLQSRCQKSIRQAHSACSYSFQNLSLYCSYSSILSLMNQI